MSYPTRSPEMMRRIRLSQVKTPPIDPDAELLALIETLYSNGILGCACAIKPVVGGQQILFQDAEATIPVAVDGDPVRVVLDLSGGENHLFAPSSAARPTYRVINGIPRLRFDGVDDGLRTMNAVSFSTPYTHGAAVIVTNYGGRIAADTDNLGGQLVMYDGRYGIYNGAFLYPTPTDVTVANTIIATSNGANSEIMVGREGYTDSVVGDTGDRFTSLDGVAIGYRVFGNTLFADMDLFGFFFVNRALDDSEKGQLESYLVGVMP
ncbi:MAG: hypothetical protein ACPHP8_08700 [Luminiphilus sp.]